MDPIDAFLAQQSDVGRTESEGSFTVSGARALEKLSAHQLPRTSAWTLKMLQAGVAASASAIWVSHGAKSCKFSIKGADLGELEDLEEFWTHPAPTLNLGQRHLLVALRAVAFARRRPVLIGHNSSQFGLRTLFWNGRSLSKVKPLDKTFLTSLKLGNPTPGEMVFYVGGSPLGQDESVKAVHGVKDVTAAEFKDLQNHGVCCPVPVWVDSRALNHFGLEDVSMTRKALAFSAQAPSEGEERVTMALPSGVKNQVPDLDAGARLAWTLYVGSEPTASRVSWVNGGVVCEEENLHVPFDSFNVRLFVPAEDLETDLTALHLRFPSKQERYRRVARAVLDFCREIEPGSPIVGKIAETQGQGKGWFAAVGLILGGVVFALPTSGLSLLAGLGAAVGVKLHEKNTAKTRAVPALERFRQTLQSRYEGHA
jgi:hypothetical protein